MLLDSNLIIYASKPGYDGLLDWMSQQPMVSDRPEVIVVSAISQLVVQGYHRLTPPERQFFVDFFASLPILSITPEIINQAIALRQQRKMSLGDATIAATAIVHQLPIATHNVTDFQWVPNLTVIDPIAP